MPDVLTERQRRLLDAVLILAVVALGVHRARLRGQRVLRVRRHPAAVLPRLAAVVRAAAADQRSWARAGPAGAARPAAVIIVYLTIVVLLLGILVQASATLYASISQFLEDAPEFESQLTILLTEHPVAAGGARPAGRPRRPGPDDRREPPGVGRRARRAAAVAGRREHRRVRQRPAARDPVDLHRARPRGHPRVPVPPRAAGLRAPRRGCSRRRVAVVRRLPARPADHGPGVRRVHGASSTSCSGCSTPRSRPSPPACSR